MYVCFFKPHPGPRPQSAPQTYTLPEDPYGGPWCGTGMRKAYGGPAAWQEPTGAPRLAAAPSHFREWWASEGTPPSPLHKTYARP